MFQRNGSKDMTNGSVLRNKCQSFILHWLETISMCFRIILMSKYNTWWYQILKAQWWIPPNNHGGGHWPSSGWGHTYAHGRGVNNTVVLHALLHKHERNERKKSAAMNYHPLNTKTKTKSRSMGVALGRVSPSAFVGVGGRGHCCAGSSWVPCAPRLPHHHARETTLPLPADPLSPRPSRAHDVHGRAGRIFDCWSSR